MIEVQCPDCGGRGTCMSRTLPGWRFSCATCDGEGWVTLTAAQPETTREKGNG